VGRRFGAGAVVKLKELRDGECFVTIATKLEGVVIERHTDGIVVDLERGDDLVRRRVHPDVRVAVA